MDEKNKLYFGDNLKILRDYVADASADLIYLDPACPPRRACAGRPPFNSSATQGFSVAALYERRFLDKEKPGGHRPPLQRPAKNPPRRSWPSRILGAGGPRKTN
jgi:hypothetical protein